MSTEARPKNPEETFNIYLSQLNALSSQGAPEAAFMDVGSKLAEMETEVLMKNDPLLFAKICERALEDVGDPFIKAILTLGVFNGYRRVDASADKAREWQENAEKMIAVLPGADIDDARLKRCKNYLSYQQGVFGFRQGDYGKAVEAHRYNENNPELQRDERAISSYLSDFYSFCDAVRGDNFNVSQWESRLLVNFNAIQSATANLASNHKNRIWANCNGTMHLMQAWIFAKISPSEEVSVATLLKFTENSSHWGPRNRAWSKVFEAMKNPNELRVIADSTREEDDVMAARLILARRYQHANKVEEAKVEYKRINVVPNGHMIYAVALRELATLG